MNGICKENFNQDIIITTVINITNTLTDTIISQKEIKRAK